MSLTKFFVLLLSLIGGSLVAAAQTNPFLGKWDIQGTAPNENAVYWLEVRQVGGGLEGWFLNRGGSVLKVSNLSLNNGELTFATTDKPNAPTVRAKVEGNRLVGSTTNNNQTINWVGVRPPQWDDYDANAKHQYGKPVNLFDGKTLDNWGVQYKEKPLGWKIENGVMTNEAHGNNLISKQTFKDYKIHCEYKLDKESNSGIYLRGRYELQVLDDFGKGTESHGHMALYSRVAPMLNASRPIGEWQTMEAVIVGNRVTVTLNGRVVQNNIQIDGITGGALDSNEGAPGPVMLQGDHGRVWFRKVVVTPITKP